MFVLVTASVKSTYNKFIEKNGLSSEDYKYVTLRNAQKCQDRVYNLEHTSDVEELLFNLQNATPLQEVVNPTNQPKIVSGVEEKYDSLMKEVYSPLKVIVTMLCTLSFGQAVYKENLNMFSLQGLSGIRTKELVSKFLSITKKLLNHTHKANKLEPKAKEIFDSKLFQALYLYNSETLNMVATEQQRQMFLGGLIFICDNRDTDDIKIDKDSITINFPTLIDNVTIHINDTSEDIDISRLKPEAVYSLVEEICITLMFEKENTEASGS